VRSMLGMEVSKRKKGRGMRAAAAANAADSGRLAALGGYLVRKAEKGPAGRLMAARRYRWMRRWVYVPDPVSAGGAGPRCVVQAASDPGA
jgi:hypothetical protein